MIRRTFLKMFAGLFGATLVASKAKPAQLPNEDPIILWPISTEDRHKFPEFVIAYRENMPTWAIGSDGLTSLSFRLDALISNCPSDLELCKWLATRSVKAIHALINNMHLVSVNRTTTPTITPHVFHVRYSVVYEEREKPT